MSSRRAKPAEVGAATGKGENMKPTIVAYDGLGVIVNSANPIKGLTKKQVEQIFTGDVTDWSAVGGSGGKISIYTRNTSSGTYSDWKELAMKKRDYAKGSQKMAGNEQIAAEVGKNANGIGYVGLAYMKAGGIKVVPIDGAMPSQASVLNKIWPYARPTFYYTNGEPQRRGEAIRRFHHRPGRAEDRRPGRLRFDQVGDRAANSQADNAVRLTRKPAGFSPAGFPFCGSRYRRFSSVFSVASCRLAFRTSALSPLAVGLSPSGRYPRNRILAVS